MILIHELSLNETFDEITVDISTNAGDTFTKVSFWSKDTFKDPLQEIDLTSKLALVDQDEQFTIIPSEVGITTGKFVGIFFIEFTAFDKAEDEDTLRMGIVANYLPYHECVLNNILGARIEGCGPIINEECSECANNLFFVNALLYSLNVATSFGYYEEAIRIINVLDDICEVCNNCPDLEDTLLLPGTGYSTSENLVILI